MAYFIIEIQTNADTTAVVQPIPIFNNREEAESNYHKALMYAAVSTVENHSVLLLDSYGNVPRQETYFHAPATPEEVAEANE